MLARHFLVGEAPLSKEAPAPLWAAPYFRRVLAHSATDEGLRSVQQAHSVRAPRRICSETLALLAHQVESELALD